MKTCYAFSVEKYAAPNIWAAYYSKAKSTLCPEIFMALARKSQKLGCFWKASWQESYKNLPGN